MSERVGKIIKNKNYSASTSVFPLLYIFTNTFGPAADASSFVSEDMTNERCRSSMFTLCYFYFIFISDCSSTLRELFWLHMLFLLPRG